jgi:hypothetical protein
MVHHGQYSPHIIIINIIIIIIIIKIVKKSQINPITNPVPCLVTKYDNMMVLSGTSWTIMAEHDLQWLKYLKYTAYSTFIPNGVSI